MKSPGYEKVINWISEIWQDFDPDLNERSFDQCGITSNNSDHFHNQLKHFVLNNQIVDGVVDEHQDDNNGFNDIEELEQYIDDLDTDYEREDD